MGKKRKLLMFILIPLCLIMLGVVITTLAFSNKPSDWIGYIILLIAMGVLAIAIIMTFLIILPMAKKEEDLITKETARFDITLMNSKDAITSFKDIESDEEISFTSNGIKVKGDDSIHTYDKVNLVVIQDQFYNAKINYLLVIINPTQYVNAKKFTIKMVKDVYFWLKTFNPKVYNIDAVDNAGAQNDATIKHKFKPFQRGTIYMFIVMGLLLATSIVLMFQLKNISFGVILLVVSSSMMIFNLFKPRQKLIMTDVGITHFYSNKNGEGSTILNKDIKDIILELDNKITFNSDNSSITFTFNKKMIPVIEKYIGIKKVKRRMSA